MVKRRKRISVTLFLFFLYSCIDNERRRISNNWFLSIFFVKCFEFSFSNELLVQRFYQRSEKIRSTEINATPKFSIVKFKYQPIFITTDLWRRLEFGKTNWATWHLFHWTKFIEEIQLGRVSFRPENWAISFIHIAWFFKWQSPITFKLHSMRMCRQRTHSD